MYPSAIVATMDWLYPLSGFVVGAIVGLTGMGGGSLMTPLLILLSAIHKKDWLNFHDLRHTAITRFGDENQIYLSTRESEYLLGKRNGKSGRSRYEHLKLVDSIRKKIDAYELNTAVRFAWSDTSFGEWKIKEKEREEWDTLPDSEREIVGRFRIYEDDGEPHMRPILGGPKAKE